MPLQISNRMHFWDWLIILLVGLGLCGIGPCASCLDGCGPKLQTQQIK